VSDRADLDAFIDRNSPSVLHERGGKTRRAGHERAALDISLPWRDST
jgi:hypothetical protein